jgi:hypothetical protein
MGGNEIMRIAGLPEVVCEDYRSSPHRMSYLLGWEKGIQSYWVWSERIRPWTDPRGEWDLTLNDIHHYLSITHILHTQALARRRIQIKDHWATSVNQRWFQPLHMLTRRVFFFWVSKVYYSIPNKDSDLPRTTPSHHTSQLLPTTSNTEMWCHSSHIYSQSHWQTNIPPKDVCRLTEISLIKLNHSTA